MTGALIWAAATGPAAAQDWSLRAPESASGYRAGVSVRAPAFMAATANPLATDAAFEILAQGGSAVDAAIAAQMMLTLVEPQSSGIGGGAFMLAYDAATGKVAAWDGRETAPKAADERLFLDNQGRPLAFFSAVVGGRSVGVPGVIRMLAAAHGEAGRLPWSRLFDPAIAAASNGFAVSPRLHALIESDGHLRDDPVAAEYFHGDDGKALAVSSILRNPALADTLRTLAEEGAEAFYAGRIGRQIVDKVRSHPRNPGQMTLADLAAYQARRRAPVCKPWLRWEVCGMPPPSSGGIAVNQILGILAASDFGGLTGGGMTGGAPALDAEGVHRFSEAGRLAFADRNRYLADSDFVAPPPGLLDERYLAERAKLIGERSMGTAQPGGPARGYPEGGTSQVSIVDRDGNAVAMTTSVENAFGSRQMVGGFLLNNQLTDFSFPSPPTPPGTDTGPAASFDPAPNRPQGGKRPRSSMAPTLVFERVTASEAADGRDTDRGPLTMITGSPGGSAIINYVAKVLVATLQDGLDPAAAIALPNMGSRNGPTELEQERVDPALVTALRARGHDTRLMDQTSGVQSIVRRCPGSAAIPASSAAAAGAGCQWVGAADPRREGTVRGN
ncbi:MAG: gamma-glutamyltransferase family protein [Lautropia sp.]